MSEIDQHLLRKENRINGYDTIKKKGFPDLMVDEKIDKVEYYNDGDIVIYYSEKSEEVE